MDRKETLSGLIDQNVLKTIKTFINNPGQQYYLRELAKKTRVPPASTYRILKLLLKLEIIKEYKVKKFKFYSLHDENASFIVDLLSDRKSAVQEFTETIKTDPAVKLIVLHGKEENTKANVLIIGENLNMELIRTASLAARDQYGFNIIHLTLTPQQYDQMSSMGLYPGKKVILYEQ
jgi:Fe2+ or Zn2+ uptake regulation protein